MFRGLLSYFFGETETDLSLEEARTILNTAANDNKEKLEEQTSENATGELENSTFHKIGVITAKDNNKYTIDDVYNYESTELNAGVGCRVSYISYVSERQLHVTNVTVLESDWDATVADSKSSWFYRTFTVKVVERVLREISVQPGDFKINLNKVQAQFIPLVGDWLQVEVKCDIDENVSDLTGQILEVTTIRPLRIKQFIGVVKRWDVKNETGLIDRDTFFNFDALSCGYLPCIGDKVVVEAIESEQDFCTWRAIKVLPHSIHKQHEIVQFEPEFEVNVDGIEIDDEVVVEFVRPQETRVFQMEIHNKTDADVALKDVEFHNKNGQCKLEGCYKNCVIKPNSLSSITCKCIARNYGRSKELLLFNFENFAIGRYITISLRSQAQETGNILPRNTRMSLAAREQQHRYNKNIRSYIPGQRNKQGPAFVSKRIDYYNIPDKLWDLHIDFCYDPIMFAEELLKRKPCLHKLDYHCYEDYFHTLLHLEEIEQVMMMRRYDKEKACFITNGEYLMLEIENLSERRPSIIVGDKICASDPFNSGSAVFEGIVHKVGAKHVYLKFSPMFHDGYKGEDYSIRVVGSRTSMRRYHHALGLAIRHLGRELLFPSKVQIKPAQFNIIGDVEKPILKHPQTLPNPMVDLKKRSINRIAPRRKETNIKIEWYDKSLNHYQKLAVRNILQPEAKPLPYFIFGPPGTGKTVTLIETILQILTHLPDARILVGTPSNSAADVVATRLIDTGVLKPGDLIRFVAYRSVHEDTIPMKLIPYSATADISAEGTDHTRSHKTLKNGLTLGVNCSVIGRHRVTVSTCTNIGVLFNMNFAKGHFTHIVIDEAGHLLEPETMIPLSFLDVYSGQAILAGDPQQLGPVVLSTFATEFGLSESYLERLMNRFPYTRDPQGFPETGGYDPKLVTKLVYNYRSLPDILTIPSKLFYNSELIPTISDTDSEEARLLQKVQEILPHVSGKSLSSIVFHGVEGENLQAPDSPSWFNPTEASQVFMYVNDFYRLGLKADDIGIISPYIKQIQQIRSLLIEAEFDVPKIGSVEEFQGQEFKVVILSTVRSIGNVSSNTQLNFDFLFSPRRLNVAVTRAQALLVIVGNPNLLACDSHWRNLLNYCVERGSYCGCPFYR